jgi:class 3 adenylate cyclase
VIQAVKRYDGTIAQLLGDGVLAFFGAPQAHEDDPERAIRAALAIQEQVREYAEEIRARVRGFQVRVGIHSGPVVVGDVGDDLHLEYLAVGDTVNLAARIQGAAEPGTVLISSETQRLAGPVFETQDRGRIELKGKEARSRLRRFRRVRGHATPRIEDIFASSDEIKSWPGWSRSLHLWVRARKGRGGDQRGRAGEETG